MPGGKGSRKGRGKAKAKKEAQKREASPRFATVGQFAEFYWGMVFRQDGWALPVLYFCKILVRVKAGMPVYRWDEGEEVHPIALVVEGYQLWNQTEGLPWLGLYHWEPAEGQERQDPAGVPWKQPPHGYKGELWKLPTRRVVVEAEVVRVAQRGLVFGTGPWVKLSIRLGPWRQPLYPPARCFLEGEEELKAWVGLRDGRVRLDLWFQPVRTPRSGWPHTRIVQTNPEDWDEYSMGEDDALEEDPFDRWEREGSMGPWERTELLLEQAAVANGER